VVASVAAAIALALGALTVLSGGRAGRPAPASAAGRACPSTDVATPAGAERLAADLDGDGCVETVLRLGNVLERTGPGGVVERFELGSPGDVPVLGDWDCDGRATPGVYRGAAGQAFLFDGWAAPGRPLPAVRTVAASAPPATSCR
jgi:hypothetical protein